MADLLSIGGSAASVALNPESPTGWVSLAQSVGKALGIFGGGSTPSVQQGFDVQGFVDSTGFHGTNFAFDQLGNRWDATTTNPLQDTATSEIARFKTLPAGTKIPIAYQAPPADGQAPLTNTLRSIIDRAMASIGNNLMADQNSTASNDIQAPSIPATSAPAGTVDATGAGLLVGGGTGSGGSSSVSPAPAAPVASSSNGPAWIWVALAIGAYYVSKH